MRTLALKSEQIKKDWYIVDADGQVLGRLATRIATVLRGKHKPTFSPHLDMGDCVVVTNADKIVATGAKEVQKVYWRHSGFPGGQKTKNLETMRKKHPERVIENAVRGMLPHNRLGRKMLKHLKVYAGPDHPHQAQQPKPLDI
ncbi:MAG: 50S ribosomal protein L13 [Fidelibacterota bacterium]|nr:MAG: 50S ribosomal protein L13 [Candidatus Neomarinimicrobiota bacterium]